MGTCGDFPKIKGTISGVPGHNSLVKDSRTLVPIIGLQPYKPLTSNRQPTWELLGACYIPLVARWRAIKDLGYILLVPLWRDVSRMWAPALLQAFGFYLLPFVGLKWIVGPFQGTLG